MADECGIVAEGGKAKSRSGRGRGGHRCEVNSDGGERAVTGRRREEHTFQAKVEFKSKL